MLKQLKVNTSAFLLGCVGFCLAFKTVGDLDFWWHLSAGRWIIENKEFVHSDFLSYTFKDAPWMDLTWGFEVIQYLLYSITHNYWFVSFFFGVLGFFTAYFTALTLELLKDENDPITNCLSLCVCILGLYFVDFRWIHRPEQFTHLYGAALFFILFLNKKAPTKAVWWIPLIQIAWVNTHGLFLIGPVITGVFLFDSLVPNIRDFKNTLLKERLLKVLGVQFAVCLLNPRGWDGASFPFHLWEVLNHPFYRTTIPEATNPYKGGVWGIDTWALTVYSVVFCLVFLFPFKKEQCKEKVFKYGIGYLVFSLLLFRLSVIARRNIALFILWTLPFVANELSIALKQLVEAFREEKFFKRARNLSYGVSFIVCIGLASNLLRPEAGNTRFGGELASFEFPTGAIEKLKTLGKIPRFFAGVQFSDFMGFQLPGYEPYIDGRFAEVYPTEHFQRYMDVLAHPRLIDAEAERWKIEAMGLETRNPMLHSLIRYIALHPQWELFYADEAAVVFLKVKEGEKKKDNVALAASYGRKRISEIIGDKSNWNPLDAKAKPHTALGLTRLSETLLLLDANLVAEEAVSQALKIVPEFPSALSMQCVGSFSILEQKVSQVGNNSEKMQQLISQEAPLVEEKCRKAKKLGADKTSALFTAALLHLNLGKYQDSAREFGELVKRDPLSPQGHMLLGRSLAAMGRLPEAEVSYLEAARLRPMEGDSLMELAGMYEMRGQKEKAKFYKTEASNRMQMQRMNH